MQASDEEIYREKYYGLLYLTNMRDGATPEAEQLRDEINDLVSRIGAERCNEIAAEVDRLPIDD